VLAINDREVVAALFGPVNSTLGSLGACMANADLFNPSVFIAKICIDPQSTVARLESLTRCRLVLPRTQIPRMVSAGSSRMKVKQPNMPVGVPGDERLAVTEERK
jgi:hypothetical protein